VQPIVDRRQLIGAPKQISSPAKLCADVALFAEMWSIGHQPFDPKQPGDREAWLSLAMSVEGPLVRHFREEARALNLAIGVTYIERRPHGLTGP
jgi:predicted amidohydrolase